MRAARTALRNVATVRDKSYEGTMRTLLSFQSNEAAQERWRQERLSNRVVDLSTEVKEHMKAIGADMDMLSVIHVAGTKGKGSVCQFAESIIRHAGFSTGTFISPHLVEPRERIRLQGRPISREQFVQYFWETFDRLHAVGATVPPFFRFMHLMSTLLFQRERVDVSIFEVGVGGRTCSTNIVSAPIVCGITRLGMDHMDVLGPTLADIASEKAGIIKSGVPCFTTRQLPEAFAVLQKQAHLRSAYLRVTDPLPASTALGLDGEFQQHNAALGMSLARFWIAHRSSGTASVVEQKLRVESLLTNSFPTPVERTALLQTRWRGRAQIVPISPDVSMFIDGAHNGESCALALRWFHQASALHPGRKRVLFCNFKPNKQLEEMIAVLSQGNWDRVVFVPSSARIRQDETWQRHLQQLWQNAVPEHSPRLATAGDFGEAMGQVQGPANVFVTGSLYLAGAALEYLRWDVDDL